MGLDFEHFDTQNYSLNLIWQTLREQNAHRSFNLIESYNLIESQQRFILKRTELNRT